MLVVLAVALVLMLCATWIHRMIGRSGAIMVSRVMGLILSSVAATSILNGIKAFFEL